MIWVGVPVVAFLSVLIAIGWKSSQPSYDGESLSYWFYQYAHRRSIDAERAIQEIGTNAIPYLVSELKSSHRFRTSDKYSEIWVSLKRVPGAHSILPRPFSLRNNKEGVIDALLMVGRDSNLTLDALCDAFLNDPHWNIRHQALRAVQEIGPGAAEAVPMIIEALEHDENDHVRARAAICLMELGELADTGAPALIRALNDDEDRVRNWAISALGVVGADPQLSVSRLQQLRDERPDLRERINKSITQILNRTQPALAPNGGG